MDSQQQPIFLAAIVGVLVIGVIAFFVLSPKKKVEVASKSARKLAPSAPAMSGASSAGSGDESAAAAALTKSKRKRAKAKTKAKNVAPVDKMDDYAPDSDDDEETPTPSPKPVPPAKKEAPPAPKPKKTEADKVVEEILKMSKAEKKGTKGDKKGGKKSPKDVHKMEESPPSPEDSDNGGNEQIYLNSKKGAAFEILQSNAAYEGWAVVESTRRAKPKTKSDSPVQEEVSTPSAAAAPAPAPAPVPAPTPAAAPVEETATDEEEEEEEVPAAPPAPVIETVTQDMTVEAKRLGLLIGVKGATRIAIQSATDTNIQMPKTEKDSTGEITITVTGVQANVEKAVQAMKELLSKGYCMLLADEDFRESDVTVLPKYLPDIIGKNGAVIRALSNHTGVKITVPNVANKAAGPDGRVSKVKVGLAGPKDKIAQCRGLIKELIKYFHTAVTHPGVIHEEMDIDKKYYNYIIGAKGSEIKHIQNSYKVAVYIPDADSLCPHLLIVGEEGPVASARRHIEKLIDKVNERNNPKPKSDDEEDDDVDAVPGTEEEVAVEPTPAASAASPVVTVDEVAWLPAGSESASAAPAGPPIGLAPPAGKDGKAAWGGIKSW